MNLTIMLLVSRRYVSRAEIKERIEGYRDLPQATFERTFERDKDELRELGIPIETGSNDAFFDDEEGYRISRQDFELPPVEFSPDEAAVLSLAANVWQEASASEEVAAALMKLQAGNQPTSSRLHNLVPRIGPRDPAFDVLQAAIAEHREVRFDYREPGQHRTVWPWQLAMRGMAWYLLGHDVDRGESRVFKLSRMRSLPSLGAKVDYQIPAGEQIADRFGELDDEVQLLLGIRDGRAAALRRAGRPVAVSSDLPDGFSAWQVTQRRLGLAQTLASFADDIVVLEPPDVREQVIAHLRQVAAHSGSQRAEVTK